MNVAMSIRAKGLRGYAARTGSIASRFGFGETEMRRALDRYLAVTATVGALPTLPITGVVLSRHPRLAAEYAARGVEFAVHGLVHADHATLSPERQAHDLVAAVTRFRDAGIEFSGFRGPYLQYSSVTDDLLRQLGFRYHSSQAIHHPVLDRGRLADDRYRRALSFYRAWDSDRFVGRPRDGDGLLHIPVAVPDDEMLIDRLRLGASAQIAAWRAVLAATRRRGELFTLQLHPERIGDGEDALAAVLSDAKASGDVWIAQLGEIANWWQLRGASRIDVRQAGPGRSRVLLHGQGAERLEILQPSRSVTRIRPEETADLETSVPPIVGVAVDAPDAVESFLREEGYVVERASSPTHVAVFIDPSEGWSEQSVLGEVGAARHALVRVARWPAGFTSALSVTGDIDSITYQDFALRLWETR